MWCHKLPQSLILEDMEQVESLLGLLQFSEVILGPTTNVHSYHTFLLWWRLALWGDSIVDAHITFGTGSFLMNNDGPKCVTVTSWQVLGNFHVYDSWLYELWVHMGAFFFFRSKGILAGHSQLRIWGSWSCFICISKWRYIGHHSSLRHYFNRKHKH